MTSAPGYKSAAGRAGRSFRGRAAEGQHAAGERARAGRGRGLLTEGRLAAGGCGAAGGETAALPGAVWWQAGLSPERASSGGGGRPGPSPQAAAVKAFRVRIVNGVFVGCVF